jgi:hypothetical protein
MQTPEARPLLRDHAHDSELKILLRGPCERQHLYNARHATRDTQPRAMATAAGSHRSYARGMATRVAMPLSAAVRPLGAREFT